MTSPTPTLADLAPALADAFRRHDYTVEGLERRLRPEAVAALGRSDAATVRRYACSAGPAGLLVRLFALGDPLPTSAVTDALPGVEPRAGVDAGLWEPADGGAALRAVVDLRPVDTGHGTRWVFADPDGSMVRTVTRPDHVLGVGQATLSLLRVTPTSPTGSVLDVGTGCGIQMVHALDTAGSATGTDITPRCLELAAATLAINDLRAELLRGSWFEPVAGRRFDRIVANPPFVVGPPETGHSYRESGLALDGASRTVVSGAADHLADGGTAVMLASWVEREDTDWRSRVASWVPSEGVDAWILRRDVSEPGLYVWTWLTDEGMDPRDESTWRATDRWLDHFEAEDVAGVGFGYVYLRRVEGPSSVLCEDLTHPFGEGLGDEAEAYFARTAWLRAAAGRHGGQDRALDATVFTVSPDVHLHVSESLAPTDPEGAGAPGASTVVVERVTGARWRHEIDPLTAAVLKGARTGALPLEDLVVLAAAGAGEDPDELAAPVRRVIADLFVHGFVVPVGVPGLLPPGAVAAAPGGPRG
ncbi:DUF7782 domain-containing protein [Dietzia massiliensis]|uniref:DUF7782 domain-containing protein n=1 Tax=Dietzia massiliensis TaxID=2697499 RepID=UPI001BCE7F81|nr:methyltransferase [Dietzia massiliensis]MBS7548086.1 methyltransferase [Dietzia massiliensis]